MDVESEMAEILSSQYSSIFSKPSAELRCEDLEDFVSPEEQNFDDQRFLQEVIFTRKGVKEALVDMSESAAPGPDGMYVACYKRGGQVMAEFLAKLMNESMKEADIPLLLRLSMITSIYKGKEKFKAVNYSKTYL